jgi:hypothetical protein
MDRLKKRFRINTIKLVILVIAILIAYLKN